MELAGVSKSLSTIQYKQVSELSATFEKQSDGEQVELTALQYSERTEILAASLEVSQQSGNEALSLLYEKAISSLNVELEGLMGPNAIDNAYQSGLDVSPEATANRIVSMSTGFFDAYSAQNPGLSETEVLDKFMSVISGGIDNGFKEAREILDALDVLQGDIAANIDKTYDFVQEGLDTFYQRFFEAPDDAPQQDKVA